MSDIYRKKQLMKARGIGQKPKKRSAWATIKRGIRRVHTPQTYLAKRYLNR